MGRKRAHHYGGCHFSSPGDFCFILFYGSQRRFAVITTAKSTPFKNLKKNLKNKNLGKNGASQRQISCQHGLLKSYSVQTTQRRVKTVKAVKIFHPALLKASNVWYKRLRSCSTWRRVDCKSAKTCRWHTFSHWAGCVWYYENDMWTIENCPDCPLTHDSLIFNQSFAMKTKYFRFD